MSDAALSVLLLEDSRFDAELLEASLCAAWPNARLQVVQDETGFKAALARGDHDVILSDYQLPGYGGEHALAHALRAAPGTPFIFVSGVIGEDNAVEMLKRGATDYVSKGRLARLPSVIERALREVEVRRAREDAEARLREAGELYARVVDSLRDYAVILMDAHGRIRSWNGAAREIFGYSLGEVAGSDAQLLYCAEDREQQVFAHEMRIAREGGKASTERWMVRADGSRFWAEGSLTPLYSAAGELHGFSKIVHDGTEAYRQAQALREAKEEAERANLAKDRFLAVLSHELRTPLTPIGAAAHVLEHSAIVRPEHSHLLPMIRRNVALEARLIDDLLDLTSISAGKVSLKPGPVDMHRLVQVVVDMVAGQIAERQLRVELELRASAPIVTADEARMHQVVWNILRNAIKFTEPGGSVRVSTGSHEGTFTLRCTDTGIGIDAAALPRIFTAFEQADAEVSQRFGGLGLGLAIARGLVAQHEGTLTAASEGRGRGATFTLTLRGARPMALAEPGGNLAMPRRAQPGCRLLLVEDNADAADALAMGLEAYGYDVTHAGGYARALQLAQQEPAFDVVVTDLGLPDGNGIELGRLLSVRMPVIALSGYGAPQDVARSVQAGFSGHIVKPAEFSAVHSMVQKALAQRADASQTG